MGLRLLSSFAGKLLLAATLALVALISSPAESGSGNPFDKLKGYWSGGGTVNPLRGNAEKVSCRVTYIVKGNSVAQNMRCAGTDYKFATRSKLTYKAGRISGSWSETTYSAAGSVSGASSITI